MRDEVIGFHCDQSVGRSVVHRFVAICIVTVNRANGRIDLTSAGARLAGGHHSNATALAGGGLF